MRKTILISLGAGALAVVGLVTWIVVRSDSTAAARQPATLSVLFSQTAQSGRIERAAGGNYSLVLERVDAHTIAFADRPSRRAGVIRTADLVRRWNDGFGEDPPNAALVEHNRRGKADTVVLELSDPVYDGRAAELRYHARVLAEEERPDRLSGVGRQVHEAPPAAFGKVSLFIDDDDWKQSGCCQVGSGR